MAAKVVEEVFELPAGGQVIRATHEHPFFVVGQDWTAANELPCADKATVAVELGPPGHL